MVIRTHTINQSDDPNQPIIPDWSVPYEYRTPDMKSSVLATRTGFFDKTHQLDSMEGQSALERHIQVEEERTQTLFQNPYLLYRVPGPRKFLFISCIIISVVHLLIASGVLLFDFLGLFFPSGYDFNMFGISSRKFIAVDNVALYASVTSRVTYFVFILLVSILGLFCFVITMISFKTSTNINNQQPASFFSKYRNWIMRIFALYTISVTLCMLVTALFFLNVGLLAFVLLAVQWILWSISLKARDRCMVTYYTTNSF